MVLPFSPTILLKNSVFGGFDGGFEFLGTPIQGFFLEFFGLLFGVRSPGNGLELLFAFVSSFGT